MYWPIIGGHLLTQEIEVLKCPKACPGPWKYPYMSLIQYCSKSAAHHVTILNNEWITSWLHHIISYINTNKQINHTWQFRQYITVPFSECSIPRHVLRVMKEHTRATSKGILPSSHLDPGVVRSETKLVGVCIGITFCAWVRMRVR